MICCHVDNFLHGGDEYFELLMKKIEKDCAGKVEEKLFRYIGFKVKQFDNKVILDHSEYIDKMKTEILNPKRASAKMNY